MNARFLSLFAIAACGGSGPTAGGGPPVDNEPVYDASATMVYQDNMNSYVSLLDMAGTIGSLVPGFHPGDDPRNELVLLGTGRGGSGKALRVAFQGGYQTGASWDTHAIPAQSDNVSHYIQYYARVNFSGALNGGTVGVKWLMGWHESSDRIQWHMHWPNSTCPSRAAMSRATYWQVMDQSEFTSCQGAQPKGPYIEDVNDNQWHRFTHEYKPNTSAGARNGVARMWIDGVKVLDVSASVCGITPPGGEKPWCSVDDVDNLAVNDGIYYLKFGGTQTTDTPAWTLDIDDLRWWRR